MRRVLTRTGSLLIAALLAIGLLSCSADPLAQQYRAGDNKGYVAGDGNIVETPLDQRGDPVQFTAQTETGATVSRSDYDGQVLVVNFWYAACAPCRVEAPRLEKAYQEFAGQKVAFLGVNTYDQAATAASFAQNYGVTYPSIIDVDDKKATAAFAQVVPLSATPVTVVLDPQGRVSARVVGELADASILTALVRTALEGSS